MAGMRKQYLTSRSIAAGREDSPSRRDFSVREDSLSPDGSSLREDSPLRQGFSLPDGSSPREGSSVLEDSPSEEGFPATFAAASAQVGDSRRVIARRPRPPKLYRIGEVVEYSGMSRQTIHNYTTMGLLPESRWTAGGHRLYDESTFERLDVIVELKVRNKSLQDIREFFDRRDAEMHRRAAGSAESPGEGEAG